MRARGDGDLWGKSKTLTTEGTGKQGGNLQETRLWVPPVFLRVPCGSAFRW